MNKYYCSDGSRVSEATVNRNLTAAYRKKYAGEPHPYCRGCGQPSQGSAHSIPKSILKQLHKTELIWNPEMFWPACHRCNLIAENPQGEDFTKLRNHSQVVSVIELYISERLI